VFPGDNIHSVTENVTVLYDDITDIEAYSKFDAFVGGDLGIALGHCGLDLTCTPQSVDNTRKLDEQPVSGGFDDASSVFANLRVDHVDADRPQPVESTFLVCADQPRISFHISGENRGETAGCHHPSRHPALRRPSSM